MRPTITATGIPDLLQLSALCTHDHEHETLQGKVRVTQSDCLIRNVWETGLASRSPPSLCRSWAALLRALAPAPALLHGDPRRPPDGESELARAIGAQLSRPTPRPCCPASDGAGWELHHAGCGSLPDDLRGHAARRRWPPRRTARPSEAAVRDDWHAPKGDCRNLAAQRRLPAPQARTTRDCCHLPEGKRRVQDLRLPGPLSASPSPPPTLKEGRDHLNAGPIGGWGAPGRVGIGLGSG